MLFALDNIDVKPEEELCQEESEKTKSTSPPVKRLDRKKDLWAPRYLCIAQPLTPFTPYEESFTIKLSDMGGAYFFTDPPNKSVTPTGLRAPELILGETGAAAYNNKTLDIWSFGCLIFELMTGQPLCCVPGSDFEDDDHLLVLTERLGALPNALFEQWKTASRYFTPDRKFFNSALGGVKEGEEPLILEEKSMEESFDEAGPEIDEEEARKIKMLIRRILQYDPAKRPSTADILRYPWFSESNLSL